jgi:hypothetical protein
MSSKVQSLKFPSSPLSPQSPRENVNHGGQESQRTNVRQNIFLNVQNEDVANTWTEVFRARTSRLKNRQKVSYTQSENKYFTPSSPSGFVKGFSLSTTTERKRSSFNKARSNARLAKEEKSQKEIAALQAQVATLTSSLDYLMMVLKGRTGVTPLAHQFPEISPLSKFSEGTPNKASYKDAEGSKSPSPTKSVSGTSTTSSSHVDSTPSSPRESAAEGKHDGIASSSPLSDGSPKGKFSTSPKRSPPVVAPAATVDRREMSNANANANANVTATAIANATANARPASLFVFTDRSGVHIDSGVVTGVYGPPDGVNGSGGVPKDCGGVPSDGSNRACEGEQLWSPDPPTPSAGELYSTIPATRMATDNQPLKFANLQVVWYTNAITTIVHTFDYLQRLQRGMMESICKKKSQRQRPCYFTDMNINCFLSTNPERNLAKVPRNLEGNFSDGNLNIKPSNVRGNQPMLLPQVPYQRIIQFLGGC